MRHKRLRLTAPLSGHISAKAAPGIYEARKIGDRWWVGVRTAHTHDCWVPVESFERQVYAVINADSRNLKAAAGHLRSTSGQQPR